MSLPTLKKNVSLRALNTFGIPVESHYFALIEEIETLQKLLSDPSIQALPKLVLGGGSNILFTKNFEGVVLKNAIKGKLIIKEDKDHVWIKAGAGENWHEFVMYCIQQGYGGLENLSLIPGTIGAAPIQNIGAYGVELKDTFSHLEAFDLQTGHPHIFTNNDCQFAYRDSVFKRELKAKFMIATVVFQLNKKPALNIEYAALKDSLKDIPREKMDIKLVSDKVIHIRRSKLPDPKTLGNAGSFFKNPIISQQQLDKIQQQFPAIPHFVQQDGIKINAGWLIEQCGWKGKRSGNVGTYEKQALVLVNYGAKNGMELLDFAKQIQQSVLSKFEIWLEPEVQII